MGTNLKNVWPLNTKDILMTHSDAYHAKNDLSMNVRLLTNVSPSHTRLIFSCKAIHITCLNKL